VPDEIYIEKAATPGRTAEASLEELLTFERLLADLSARFANVSSDQLETEIERALRQLLESSALIAATSANSLPRPGPIFCVR
jgi:hypothetical protein